MRPRPRPLLEPSKEATGTDYFFEGEGFNEVTTNEPAPDVVAPETAAPLTSLRPRMRPERVPTPTPRPEYEAPTRVMNPHRNPRCENIRSRVASALGERVESSRVNCYLDLFHKETGCRHNLSQAQGNAGNPHAGYGLCSLEASAAIRRQNRRGPECATIRTVEQQTRCCASIMAKSSKAGSYFGPVRIGVVRKCD